MTLNCAPGRAQNGNPGYNLFRRCDHFHEIPMPGIDVKSIAKTFVLLALAAAGPVMIQAQISNFQHIVIIFQENRTPDNLFQGLCGQNRSQCPAPYDVRNYGIDNMGHIVQLTKVPLGNSYDPDHSHGAFVKMCDLDTTTNECRMDGLSSTGCGVGPNCSFQYVNPSDVAPYVTMAKQYGWANYMFQTNQGPSAPAHQFIFGGTSAPSAGDDGEARFVAENPKGLGCLAPLDAVYPLISPQSAPNEFDLLNNPKGTVCFSRETMATLLDKHNPKLSWKYYAPAVMLLNGLWTAPNWIKEICGPNIDFTQCTGTEWKDSVDLYPPDVLREIGACKLRNVIWVIPAGQNSDHPMPHPATGGPSWVSSIVNKIGTSTCKDMVDGKTLTYWQDTAIFLTWDDWGGFYDHERPTLLKGGQGDYQYGFRVPLVVISAYTPKGYVDNGRHDFGSILRFIERNFGIIEGELHFADQRATTDLIEFFDLNQSPRKFSVIPASLGEQFFLNDKRPMDPPDTD